MMGSRASAIYARRRRCQPAACPPRALPLLGGDPPADRSSLPPVVVDGRRQLHRDTKNVVFAGYRIPHPLEYQMVIKVGADLG